MRKSVIVGVLLTLLSVSIFSSLNIMPVKAIGTIYIRPDGSIDPPTASIQRDGDLYTLTGNINSDTDGIEIERDNMTLDGAGFTVQGTNDNIGLYMHGRKNITIRNVEIRAFYWGIYTSGSNNSRIIENDFTDNWVGINLVFSSNNDICENNIIDNKDCIELGMLSNYNNIIGNNITTQATGIGQWYSSYNNISRNKILTTTGAGFGIWLSNYSNYTCISENNITACYDGIYLDRSAYNQIYGNTEANGLIGIVLQQSPHNIIYHNDFTNNEAQADVSASVSVWDDGYPSGGNRWSNYTGVDLCSGPYQNETGSDGIGDAPYVINADNIDRYPLMHPSGYCELTVTSSPIVNIGFNLNGVNHGTPCIEWLPSGSYILEMFGAFPGYVWSHWLEDGDADQTKTITLSSAVTWTGVFTPLTPPKRTLTINSMPSGATFTVNGTSCTASWSGTLDEGTAVALEMPETYTVGGALYYWDRWSDGDASRSRTVIMNADISLTAYYTGPYYQLTVTSPPMTGIIFTINGTPRTTPYTEWLLQGSYTIEMPETNNGYTWSYWLEDGDTDRIKTLTLSGATWTAVYVPAPLDVTPPNIAAPSISPLTPVSMDTVTVLVAITDSQSGVKNGTLYYTVDDWMSVNVSRTMTFDSVSGLWTVTIVGQAYGTTVKFYETAYDNAGNIGKNDNYGQYFTYIVIDLSPPSISPISPVHGTALPYQNVAFSVFAQDSESGINKAELYIDGQLKGNMIQAGGGIYTLTVTGFISGSHTWYAKAYNGGGLTATSSTRTVIIDITPPSISAPIISPSDPTPTDTVVTDVTITDVDSGVKNATIYFRVNSGSWQTSSMDNPSGNTWRGTVPAQASGSKTDFYIVTYDNAGNRAVNDNQGNYFSYNVAYLYDVPAGTSTVDGLATSDTKVTLTTTAPGQIRITEYPVNPGGSIPSGLTSLKYVLLETTIDPSQIIWPIGIRIYYKEEEIIVANIQESTLRIYYWNGNEWVLEPDSGVVATSDVPGYSGYVWSRISHLSSFSVMGSPKGPQIPVGGEWVPIDKLQLLAPWISSVSLMMMLAATFVYVKHKKRQ